ncbi:hypothetical protein ACMD2_23013 [Ananas comosus]|uniref:Uncharacterized protein n=1 Tax=Ananas comosus TaxID=4615 RepID=A0A199UV08_ANACO|nr:hypothetical protein ACMD2_23013 [Ananas comosus]
MATTPSLTFLHLHLLLPSKPYYHPHSLPFSPRPLPPPRRRLLSSLTHRSLAAAAAASGDSSASTAAEVEMVRGGDGVPRGRPLRRASALRSAASLLGRVLAVSAYANRHAFSHLPSWVLAQRRDRRRLDLLERRAPDPPPEPYSAPSAAAAAHPPRLKRHFRQLHERERLKKLAASAPSRARRSAPLPRPLPLPRLQVR